MIFFYPSPLRNPLLGWRDVSAIKGYIYNQNNKKWAGKTTQPLKKAKGH